MTVTPWGNQPALSPWGWVGADGTNWPLSSLKSCDDWEMSAIAGKRVMLPSRKKGRKGEPGEQLTG